MVKLNEWNEAIHVLIVKERKKACWPPFIFFRFLSARDINHNIKEKNKKLDYQYTKIYNDISNLLNILIFFVTNIFLYIYNDKCNDKFNVSFNIINRVKLINNRTHSTRKMRKIDK